MVTWANQPPVWPRVRYFVGLDIGQSIDPTALAVIERREEPIDLSTIKTNPATRTTLDVRHLERLPLRTPYPDVIAHVAKTLQTAPLRGNARLVVDGTGVGKPIVDMFVRAGLRPISLTITAGDGFTQDGRNYRVSKLQLVSQLQALFHGGELRVAEGLPDARVLKSELAAFRANISDSGALTFGARAGKHDDLVLAVAIAAWFAKHASKNRAISTELQL